MSFERRTYAKKLVDGEGVTICSCGCGNRPVKPRKNWFSDACVTAWKTINNPSYIRHLVYRRDRGVCAVCGCNSSKAFKKWREDRKVTVEFVDHLLKMMSWKERRLMPGKAVIRRTKELIKKWSPPGRWTPRRKTGWDVDHIVPVSEGGGLCGLDNYRTLCQCCHKDVTTELQQRLRARRLCQTPLPLDVISALPVESPGTPVSVTAITAA